MREIPLLEFVDSYYDPFIIGTGAVGQVEKLIFNPYKYERLNRDSNDSNDETTIHAGQDKEKDFLKKSLEEMTQVYTHYAAIAEQKNDVYLRWCCQNPILARKVLVDYRENQVERFKREITTLFNIEHRNVLKIIGYTMKPFAYYMPYIEREPLEEKILTPNAASYLALTLSGVFAYLHDKDIIHRDVKPANILASKNFKAILLADFGIAKDLSSDMAGLTMQNMILGTPEFLAPEYVRPDSNAEYSKSGDMFGLGATIYSLLTGTSPLGVFLPKKIDPKTNKLISVAPMAKCITLATLDEFKFLREINPNVPERMEDAVMMKIAMKPEDRLTAHESEKVWKEIRDNKLYQFKKRTHEETQSLFEQIAQVEKKIFNGGEANLENYNMLLDLYPSDSSSITKRIIVAKKAHHFSKQMLLQPNSENERKTLEQLTELQRKKLALEEARRTRFENINK